MRNSTGLDEISRLNFPDYFSDRTIVKKSLFGTQILILMGFMFLCLETLAQVDPSSALLLRSSGRELDKDQLDSSRYVIKPQTDSDSQSNEDKQENQVKETPRTTKRPSPKKAPEKVETNEEEKPEEKTIQRKLGQGSEEGEDSPSVQEQIRDLFMGGSGSRIAKYKSLLHPKDRRRNLIEVTIAPSFIYNDSSSNYWFRDFSTNGPAFSVGTDLWLTPFFGIHTSFMASLSNEMKSDPSGTQRTIADHQLWAAGFRFRKYFGISRKASHLEFGLDFSEYRLNVPTDENFRIRTKTSGIKLQVEAHVPKSRTYTHTIGASIMPRGNHQEVRTGVEIRSGTDNETNTIGVSLGGRFQFDGRNQFFWKLKHSIEKNIFEGAVNTSDPLTGDTPDGVSVTNSLSIIEFGYVWGN